MSVDHSQPTKSKNPPVFLGVVPGDVVVVWDHPELVGSTSDGWWLGEVLFCEGNAREPKEPSLFQIADVDSGVIRWVNADQVQKVLIPVSSPFSKVVELTPN